MDLITSDQEEKWHHLHHTHKLRDEQLVSPTIHTIMWALQSNLRTAECIPAKNQPPTDWNIYDLILSAIILPDKLGFKSSVIKCIVGAKND